MSERTIKASERGERMLEKSAEEFGVSKDEILGAKLKMRGVNKQLAAALFLNGKIDEVKLADYFDSQKIKALKESRKDIESLSKQNQETEENA